MKESDFNEKMRRMVKAPSEIGKLKKAAKLSNCCISVIEDEIKKEGATERDISKAILSFAKLKKKKLAFPTIVACGKRAYSIHAKPTKKVVSGLGYVDFGIKYDGYCSDITVPFVKGKLKKSEKKLLDDTLKIYERLVGSIRIGGKCVSLHEKYRRFMENREYKVKHSLGHGLGKDVHEFPLISSPDKKKLSDRKREQWERIKKVRFGNGMVFTLEPGIYVKGIGGCRIEDDFLINDGNVEKLTESRLLII